MTLIRERGKPQAVLRMILIRGHSREHCLRPFCLNHHQPARSLLPPHSSHTHTKHLNTNTYLQTRTQIPTSVLKSQHTQSYSIQIHTYVIHKNKNTNMYRVQTQKKLNNTNMGCVQTPKHKHTPQSTKKSLS